MAGVSGAGPATAKAIAEGGSGTTGLYQSSNGGDAAASAHSLATHGGAATAVATAIGGGGGGHPSFPRPGWPDTVGIDGVANAASSAATTQGGTAQAQSTAVGSSGEALSNAGTAYSFVKVQSAAVAQVGSTATTNAVAQAGGPGQLFANPEQTAYAFSVGLPDKAYVTTLVGGASNVASALLGPRDMVFGAAILGANYAPDGAGVSHTYSATATFDFSYRGDLLLGLIDNQANGFDEGLGFQSMEFYVLNVTDGSKVLDVTLGNLSVAESFFRDFVLDLGSYSGTVDLTFGYSLTANGSGGFGMDFVVGGGVPEASTWAMVLLGFAGLRLRRVSSGKGCPRYARRLARNHWEGPMLHSKLAKFVILANTFDRSFLRRLLVTTALPLALTIGGAGVATAAVVTVVGADGANGVGGPGLPGGDASAIAVTSDPSNTAIATGGAGGAGDLSYDGGAGGAASGSSAATATGSGAASSSAIATGGAGGADGGGTGGSGGTAAASAKGSSAAGDVVVSATATGGAGGEGLFFSGGAGGTGTVFGTGVSASGHVSVSASLTGGAGGAGLFGSGGAGGSVSLDNAVSGSTASELDLIQTATGGPAGTSHLTSAASAAAAQGGRRRRS